jgi:uncharacterized protein
VIGRAEAKGENGWTVHWRRMAVLLIIGAGHAILLWRGDILTLYAIGGIVAYLFRNQPIEKLVAAGLAFCLFDVILFAAIGVTLFNQDIAAHSAGASGEAVRNWNLNLGSFYPSAQAIAEDRAIYAGSWAGIVAHEASQAGGIVTNNLILLPETLGLMLLGMAGLKSGFLTGAWTTGTYRRVAAWGISVGLIGFLALVVGDLVSRFYMPTPLTGFESLMLPFQLLMAAGYASLLVLLSRSMETLASRLAAVGRAAFSNYLGTSLVCTLVFYGWGLGLYGKLTRAEAWLIVPIVWALMLLWSKPWLDRFRYGPFEWQWRSLARGKPQPMRKTPLARAAQAEA